MGRHLRKRPDSKTTKASTALPLMLVDGTRIRQKIKREYEKVVVDLEKAREQLDHFEKEDLPKFTQWFNTQFGALLTELRETNRRIHDLEQILLEMQNEIIFSGASPCNAYARVMNRRQNSPSEDSADSEEDDRREQAREGNGKASDSGRGFDGAEADFDEFFGPGRKQAT